MNENDTNKYRNILSIITDPYLNQALEESLLNSVYLKKSDFILRVWKSEPCVIIGRNQVISAEVDIKFCQKHQIPIIRRITGGGAVFLDLGCLNFSYFFNNNCNFYKKNIHNINKLIINIMIDTLYSLSYNCELHPPNSIFLEDKKISGNAQIFKGNSVLHHGTLLYRTDLELLNRSLFPQIIKLDNKFVKSNKVKTTNLYLFNAASNDQDIINRAIEKTQETLDLNLKKDKLTNEEYEYAQILKIKKYLNLSWNNRFI